MSKNANLYTTLINKISKMKSHERFLSENQVCSIYQISRTTARNVFLKLYSKNIIYSKKGQGYFINPKELWNMGESWTVKPGKRESVIKKSKSDIHPYFKRFDNLNSSNFKCYSKEKYKENKICLVSINWFNFTKIPFEIDERLEHSLIDYIKLESESEIDHSYNFIRLERPDKKIYEVLNIVNETLIPTRYSVIQDKDLDFVHLSVEYWVPEEFETKFIQHL